MCGLLLCTCGSLGSKIEIATSHLLIRVLFMLVEMT